MSSLDKDIKSVLNCYVKRKSSGEIKFDKKQIESGFKLCEHIIHEQSQKRSGREKLKLITQISHISDNCETPTPAGDVSLSLSDNIATTSNNSSTTTTNQDYYLKSVALSHYKSKSLDAAQHGLLDNCHQTEITTVIGDSSSDQYERVHTATIHHTSSATLPETHRAFTRQVLSRGTGTVSSTSSGTSRPTSYRSLPSELNNVLVPTASTDGDTSGTKSSKKSKKRGKRFRERLKRLFSTSSTSSGPCKHQRESALPPAPDRDPGYDIVDRMFEYEFRSAEAADKPHEQKKKRGHDSNNFLAKTTTPFKSYSIGSKSSLSPPASSAGADRISPERSPQQPFPEMLARGGRGTPAVPVQDLQPLAKKSGAPTITTAAVGTGSGSKDIPRFIQSLLGGKPRHHKTGRKYVATASNGGSAIIVPDIVTSDANNNDVVTTVVQQHRRDGSEVHATFNLVGEDKPRTLLAEVEIAETAQHVQYEVYPNGLDKVDGKDDDNVFQSIAMSNRQRSMSGVSFSHFDVMGSLKKQRRPSCPVANVPKCNCDQRRIDLMADTFNLILSKNKSEALRNEKKSELEKIDLTTCHFKGCVAVAAMMDCTDMSPIDRLDCSRSQSQASLISMHSCQFCNEPDEQLDDDVTEKLLPLMAQLENESELNCPQSTIEHFLQASCYDHFEQGLLKVIGSECTPQNVARLHYLARRIVKHIGDPTDESNKTIRAILNHTWRFHQRYYQPQIKSIYRSLENFLLSGLKNDDVD